MFSLLLLKYFSYDNERFILFSTFLEMAFLLRKDHLQLCGLKIKVNILMLKSLKLTFFKPVSLIYKVVFLFIALIILHANKQFHFLNYFILNYICFPLSLFSPAQTPLFSSSYQIKAPACQWMQTYTGETVVRVSPVSRSQKHFLLYIYTYTQ